MKFYNDLTRKKEEFVPVNPGEVLMYSCGPTVYNFFHIGNARPFVVFDALRSYLEYKGYKVNFVQNFTDGDDKIIKRSHEEGISFEEVSEKYIAEYFTDAQGLGVKKATTHPKATENIDAMIELIKTLEEKGFAYAVNGDVYYRSRRFADYGKLSHMPIVSLKAVPASKWVTLRKTRLISHCGKPQKRVSLIGNHRGDVAVPAGTSNVRL